MSEAALGRSRGRDAGEDGPWAQSVRLGFLALVVATTGLAAFWATGNVRTVPADSRAVVLRFGAVDRVREAGLVLAWPRPIEEVLLLPASDRLIAQPMRRFAPASEGLRLAAETRAGGAFLLTGDGGVVRLSATVLYQITDPSAFVRARDHVEPALERLFAAAAVQEVAARGLDSVLVTRAGAGGAGAREALRGDLVRAVNARLEALEGEQAGLGVRLRRVDLVAALPGEAKDAFDEVLRAGQAAEAEIAKARTYAEAKAQEATQLRAQAFTNARAVAAEAVGTARSRTAAITALSASAAGPDGTMLLDQTYAQRIARILRRARRVDAVDPDAGGHAWLPGGNP